MEETNKFCDSIRIAWTFDDGPTKFTYSLVKQLENMKIQNCTWFISRKNVYDFNYWEQLLRIQRLGGEIAIHEIHPSLDSINWFPRESKSYTDIRQAIDDFKTFYNELQQRGVYIKFVRLPGGEYSELISYLRFLSCPQKDLYIIAARIIDGKDIPEIYFKVNDDWKLLLSELANIGVKIWSGANKNYPLLGGLPYHYNSWQAESAGIAQGRGADNITFHQSELRKIAGINEINNGVFERNIEITKNKQQTSIIVLSHDTTFEDIEEIIADIETMEHKAREQNVEIIYCTLSELFNAIR
jgi:Polysaccharide deacetylase